MSPNMSPDLMSPDLSQWDDPPRLLSCGELGTIMGIGVPVWKGDLYQPC